MTVYTHNQGTDYELVSVPDSLLDRRGGVWYSCTQKAIMGYSLIEDSHWSY